MSQSRVFSPDPGLQSAVTDHAARIIADNLRDALRPCITCSFQAEDVALVHMLRAIKPDIPVLFLDTVHHFAQTYEYRDELARTRTSAATRDKSCRAG